MLRNYFLIAFRNMIRQKLISFINIFGLATGLAACLLIYLFVQDERSFEQIHKQADQIYRLNLKLFLPNDGGSEKVARIGSAVGDIVKKDFPQVREVVKIRKLEERVIEEPDSKIRFYETIHFVDSNLFDVFTIPMLAGNPETALLEPNSVVISEHIAEKYFGRRDAVGKMIHLPEDTMQLKVSGVIENMPGNTHLKMDILAPYQLLDSVGWYYYSWWDYKTYTYLLLAKGANPGVFKEQVKRISARYVGEKEEQSGYRQEYFIQAIRNIHLHSKLRFEISPNSDVRYIYIFSIIGLFILLLAAVNFMNLSTARAAVRAKEIGLRKVIGARRKQLITQLLGESLLTAIFSMFIGLIIAYLTLPVLNDLSGKELVLGLFDQKWLAFLLIGVCVFVGIGAGVYPAVFLSSFKPVEILRGTFSSGDKGVLLRKGLLVFQFAISTVLIACTLIIYQQLRYMQEAELGFSKEQVVFLPTRGGVGTAEKFTLLKKELEKLPNLNRVSISSHVPGYEMSSNNVRKGWADEAERSYLRILAVDYDFLDLYQIKLLAGREFDRSFVTDQDEAFILNAAGMKSLGWNDPEEALGKKLRWKRKRGKIIGVTEDFHFMSVQNPIEPMLIHMGPWRVGYLSVRILVQDVRQALDQIFAYRIEPGASNFLLAGIFALSMAIITISYHLFKAIKTNPVESLRNE